MSAPNSPRLARFVYAVTIAAAVIQIFSFATGILSFRQLRAAPLSPWVQELLLHVVQWVGATGLAVMLAALKLMFLLLATAVIVAVVVVPYFLASERFGVLRERWSTVATAVVVLSAVALSVLVGLSVRANPLLSQLFPE